MKAVGRDYQPNGRLPSPLADPDMPLAAESHLKVPLDVKNGNTYVTYQAFDWYKLAC
jgi:hypothetical protein